MAGVRKLKHEGREITPSIHSRRKIERALMPVGTKHLVMMLLSRVEAMEESAAEIKQLLLVLNGAAGVWQEPDEAAGGEDHRDGSQRSPEEGDGVLAVHLGICRDFSAEVRKFEAGLIRLALKQAGGNQSKAARLLGIKRTTLHVKKQQYGL